MSNGGTKLYLHSQFYTPWRLKWLLLQSDGRTVVTRLLHSPAAVPSRIDWMGDTNMPQKREKTNVCRKRNSIWGMKKKWYCEYQLFDAQTFWHGKTSSLKICTILVGCADFWKPSSRAFKPFKNHENRPTIRRKTTSNSKSHVPGTCYCILFYRLVSW